jgi:hypothetical protein
MSLYVPLSNRPACCMAMTWLVLVLLIADGPILVRAALGTGDGGAIEAFDFSGAMAQRAGIGWYGHVCSFSSVDAGKPRAAAPQDRRGISCAGLAWATATMPDRSIGSALRLELYQIFSAVVMWSSGDTGAVTIRVSALPSFRTLGSRVGCRVGIHRGGGTAGLGSDPETGGADGQASGRHRRGDRIAAALAVWLSRSDMDRDAELLDRLANRADGYLTTLTIIATTAITAAIHALRLAIHAIRLASSAYSLAS